VPRFLEPSLFFGEKVFCKGKFYTGRFNCESIVNKKTINPSDLERAIFAF